MILGLLIVTAGALLAVLVPAQRAIAWWRWQRTAAIGALLRSAVPIAAPNPALDQLASQADQALERDDLIRGVAGVAQIYERA